MVKFQKKIVTVAKRLATIAIIFVFSSETIRSEKSTINLHVKTGAMIKIDAEEANFI